LIVDPFFRFVLFLFPIQFIKKRRSQLFCFDNNFTWIKMRKGKWIFVRDILFYCERILLVSILICRIKRWKLV
jgi:hypothetical protein